MKSHWVLLWRLPITLRLMQTSFMCPRNRLPGCPATWTPCLSLSCCPAHTVPGALASLLFLGHFCLRAFARRSLLPGAFPMTATCPRLQVSQQPAPVWLHQTRPPGPPCWPPVLAPVSLLHLLKPRRPRLCPPGSRALWLLAGLSRGKHPGECWRREESDRWPS